MCKYVFNTIDHKSIFEIVENNSDRLIKITNIVYSLFDNCSHPKRPHSARALLKLNLAEHKFILPHLS